MKDFFKSTKFKVLLALLLVMLGFMLNAATKHGVAGAVERTLGAIVAPFQKISAAISDSATSFFSKFALAGQIDKENKELKEEINELKNQLIDFEKYKTENEQFKQLLELKEHNPDYQFEPASVIGRDPNDRFGSFTIDKGSLHGISPKDPVITPEGLVGRVVEVGLTYSKVITILDPSINIGSYNIRTRDTGIVTGSVEHASKSQCKMTYLHRESGATIGDMIVTSGEGGIFPKDIIIGEITEVKPESHGISLYASINPAVDVLSVKDVVVITSFLGQGINYETPAE